MIQHPNSSGLARDQMTQLYIPAYFVRSIEVTYESRLVLRAQIDFSISENPNFRFYFLPHGGGELKAVAVDTKDRTVEGAVRVEVAPN
jgi:sulfur-oxidizing protein SoxY